MSRISCGVIAEVSCNLDERIYVNDFEPMFFNSVSESREHSGRICGGVHTDYKNRVSLLPINNVYSSLSGSDGRSEGATACFVTHIRTVRQIVRTKFAGKS